MAVSILTFALSFLVAETYPLLAAFWLIPATGAAEELRNRPAAEAGCFRQRRDTCRKAFEAIPDILLLVGKNLIASEWIRGEEAKIFRTPFTRRAKMLFEARPCSDWPERHHRAWWGLVCE